MKKFIHMGFIYKITNKINGDLYIGQTKSTIEKRFKQHIKASKKNSNNHFHNAINKYGADNFIVEEIESVLNEYLNDREVYWINYYKEKGEATYNTAGGGYNSPFFYKTDEEKSSIAKKSYESFLKNHTEDEILEINKKKSMCGKDNPNFGGSEKHKNGCIEYYKNNKDAHKGKNNPFYGKTHSEETKNKIRNALIGNKNNNQKGERNNNYGKHGSNSSNHKEVVIAFPDGTRKEFGSRKELGEYFGYSNGNKPPMNKILSSKKFPILNGAVVTYK